MPDSRRPLPSMPPGAYDDPPATSTPQTRRQRLRRAILGTNELAQEVINMASGDRQARRRTVGGLTRRRQRSSSEHHGPSTSTPEGEDRPPRRSTKRRRLNAGVEAPTKKAIKYGHYGQVEPGRLRLELVSCDGGQHVDHRHPETSLGPENLLRHDRSVYCSERPQSNVILKHADDTAFCLEKMHIVGPEMGFTAPVRAGVVYVAMTMADLQKYVDPRYDEPPHSNQPGLPPHARRSRYSLYRRQQQRRREMDSRRSSPELLTVAEALRDPYINAAHPSNTHDLDDADESGIDAEADAYCDSNPATDPTTWLHDTATDTFIHRTQPVTILSDEDAGPEESSPQDVLDFRSQRERLMRRRYDIENWHRSREAGAGAGSASTRAEGSDYSYLGAPIDRERAMLNSSDSLARLLARQRALQQNVRRRSASTDDSDGSLPPLEPITPLSQEQEREQDQRPPAPAPGPAAYCTLTNPSCSAASSSSSSTTNPHPANLADSDRDRVTPAKFAIARGKHKVAIKFDPPVSGRFVMLKLWAGESDEGCEGLEAEGRQGDGNVDVQSIVATGWMGGMRFFPCVGRK